MPPLPPAPSGPTWNSIGGGLAGWPRDVIELSNGDIVVGGTSLQPPAPEPALGRIGRWDGSSWHRFGLGLNNQVEALLELPNGHLVVGGLFTQAGGAPASRIARWDGQAWHPLGTGVSVSTGTSPFVASLTLLPNGDIVAAGDFTVAGGQTAPSIARWTSNPDCYANCDNSQATPTVTPADFVCFINRFRAGDLYANCDNSVGTPALTPADFVCFLNKFRAGCP
ncbi:hypothetical protein J4558_23180 [Leptolyngbya sp. 15MV]|nr:hypothetical protein J4558_23180 [Leptolyngbya sp. 15MV]